MICAGLATGFAIVAVGAMAHWCIDPVAGASRYEWNFQEDGVAFAGPTTNEPEAFIPTHFAQELRASVRACDAASCTEFSGWSGSAAWPLDANGDGRVGGYDFNALRLDPPVTASRFNLLRRGFGKAVGWYP